MAGAGTGQEAEGTEEENGGQRGWWEPGAGDGRVRGDRGTSREEGTSWGWVRVAGQARPAARTAQLPHRPQPQDQGRRGTAGTGPPRRGFPRDPPALQGPHGKLSPAETPRHSRHWPQPQEAEGSRETLSVVGDRGLETGMPQHEVARPPVAPVLALTPGLRSAWAAPMASRGGVRRGAWTQLPPESAASALLLTPAEPSRGWAQLCPRRTLGCPTRDQPGRPPRKQGQDASTPERVLVSCPHQVLWGSPRAC